MPVMRVRFPNEISELRRLNESAARFLWASRAPTSSIQDVQLVLEEVVTNVIRYAWPDGGRHAIDVEVALAPDEIHVRVEDDGRPFDPTTAPDDSLPATLEDRAAGGVGLRIVRRTATSVRYSRRNGRNILELEVPLAEPALESR